jgi:hypothetical protein
LPSPAGCHTIGSFSPVPCQYKASHKGQPHTITNMWPLGVLLVTPSAAPSDRPAPAMYTALHTLTPSHHSRRQTHTHTMIREHASRRGLHTTEIPHTHTHTSRSHSCPAHHTTAAAATAATAPPAPPTALLPLLLGGRGGGTSLATSAVEQLWRQPRFPLCCISLNSPVLHRCYTSSCRAVAAAPRPSSSGLRLLLALPPCPRHLSNPASVGPAAAAAHPGLLCAASA